MNLDLRKHRIKIILKDNGIILIKRRMGNWIISKMDTQMSINFPIGTKNSKSLIRGFIDRNKDVRVISSYPMY